VTGIAARHLVTNPSATPAQVRSYIVDMATSGVLSNLGTGSPNLLAFIPRLLTTVIVGPDTITEAGAYDWFADVDGGDYLGYDHAWAYRTVHVWGYGDWTSLGTDTVASRSLSHHDAPFELRLAVGSGVQADTSILLVGTFCDPCPNFHDPPDDTLSLSLTR
jgi:hypothetical protein